jgi:tetratricopeptide (TPR) repeat protein
MHDKEIKLFTNGLKFAQDEFFLDSIKEFQSLVNEYPDSELADDALYNIGLCYFHVGQFENAIQTFFKVIQEYPDSTISILDGGNEFGKTAAKCHYSIMNCYLALGNVEKAKKHIEELSSFIDSYKVINNQKNSFHSIAKEAYNTYENIKS